MNRSVGNIMKHHNYITFAFLTTTILLVSALIYTNSSIKKQSEEHKIKLSISIDSVRTAVIDSMQKVSQNKFSESRTNISSKLMKPIELFDLINLFTPNEKFDHNIYEWKTEANNQSINWLTHGVEIRDHDFYREGETVVSVNAKVIECLDTNSYPCKWGLALSGVRGGYTSFEISSVQSQALEEMSLKELFKNNKFEAKILKTDELNNKTYLVKFPNKKSIKMTVNWSCGSAGCSLNVNCNTEL